MGAHPLVAADQVVLYSKSHQNDIWHSLGLGVKDSETKQNINNNKKKKKIVRYIKIFAISGV